MKAKEYAAKYNTEIAAGKEPIDVLIDTLFEFTKEFGKLTLDRGCKTDAAAIACFLETEQKYKAFCRLASSENTELKPDGLRWYIKAIDPVLWEMLEAILLKYK
jgi:hypothetical protein